MKAMILAAGRGERLGALTMETPKPLIAVEGVGGVEEADGSRVEGVGGSGAGDTPLGRAAGELSRGSESRVGGSGRGVEGVGGRGRGGGGSGTPLGWTLGELSRVGFSQVVINISHLGGQIRGAIGDGGDYGVGVLYSEEDSPLETAGGVRLALERGLLDWDSPFALVNGDILTDYDFGRLRGGLGGGVGEVEGVGGEGAVEGVGGACRLVLVPNPPEHLGGDFSLDGRGRLVRLAGGNSLTYSGVGVFSPQMFSDLRAGDSAGLGPLLFSAAELGRADYEVHNGAWFDIGRPESLARARREWKGRGE